MLLRGIANNRAVIGMRGDIDILVRKAFARDRAEAEEARSEIVKGAVESAKRVADLALHIAEQYGFAMSAMEQRNFDLVADVLARARELVGHLEKAVEEEKKWREAYWKVIGGEYE